MYKQTIEILGYLNRCQPVSLSKHDPLERNLKKASYWLLFCGMGFVALLFLTVCLYRIYPFGGLRVFAMILFIAAVFFLLLSLLVEPLGALVGLVRWKTQVLTNLLCEINHDELHARHLLRYSMKERDYVEYCLQVKIANGENRVKLFFGEKTAIIALFLFSFVTMKELVGWDWFTSIISWEGGWSGSINKLVWFFWALLMGFSLGAIATKINVARYYYQMSLLKLATKLQALDSVK